jgi:hypothetical protein
MSCYNGPYIITSISFSYSTVTLDLPNKKTFPTFHISHVLLFKENDSDLFLHHELSKPPPVILDNKEEWFIDQIIDE